MNQVSIREFQSQDYEQVEDIWKKTHLFLPLDVRVIYMGRMQGNSDLFLVAEKEGRVIGSVLGFFPYFPSSILIETRIGYIGHLAVDPTVQGYGVGSRLLREICANFMSHGKSLALLFVDPSEGTFTDLRRFYTEKHGFRNLGPIFIKKLNNPHDKTTFK